MSWGMVAVAGASVIGGAMSAGAASDAAEGQQQAAQQSNALQMAMYNSNVQIAAPQVNTGNAARDRLSFLLGLSPTGFTNGGAGSRQINGYAPGLTATELRDQLKGRYTTQTLLPSGAASLASDPNYQRMLQMGVSEADAAAAIAQQRTGTAGNRGTGNGFQGDQGWVMENGTNPQALYGDQIDEAGLRAEMDAYYAEQKRQEDELRNNPEFGRLAQGFTFDKYTPEKFSYTGQDLYDDPSYKFRLEQGQKAIDRQGAAAGRFLSGGQLQASSNYNQSAASQEFQAAYQRAAGTFNTNEGNRFGAFQANEGNRYNAYQTNFTNTVNPLLALSGAGQLAGAQLMNTNSNYASNVGANLMGAANASGAAGIAGANAINGAIGNVSGQYQTSQLMNRFGGSLNSNPGATAAASQYPPGYFSGAYAGDAI